MRNKHTVKNLRWSLFAKIVNGFYLLTIFVKKLLCRCLTGFWNTPLTENFHKNQFLKWLIVKLLLPHVKEKTSIQTLQGPKRSYMERVKINKFNFYWRLTPVYICLIKVTRRKTKVSQSGIFSAIDAYI